jgi:hypothetical protein
MKIVKTKYKTEMMPTAQASCNILMNKPVRFSFCLSCQFFIMYVVYYNFHISTPRHFNCILQKQAVDEAKQVSISLIRLQHKLKEDKEMESKINKTFLYLFYFFMFYM